MSFMQKQIYKGTYFQVETTAGTEIVPTDDVGRTMNVHVDALLNYLEGKPIDPEELCEVQEGYLARMAAPGYLDKTEWTVHKTQEAAQRYLDEAYANDEAPQAPATPRNSAGPSVEAD